MSICLSVHQSVCQSVTKIHQPLRIAPINHQDYWAYWPTSLSTIKPIDHQAYRPSSLSAIKPINHQAYCQSSLLNSGLLRLLSLLDCSRSMKGIFLKLLSYVRGQNGGSLGCPAQLDHFQMAYTRFSCVYTCSPW